MSSAPQLTQSSASPGDLIWIILLALICAADFSFGRNHWVSGALAITLTIRVTAAIALRMAGPTDTLAPWLAGVSTLASLVGLVLLTYAVFVFWPRARAPRSGAPNDETDETPGYSHDER